MTECCRLKNRKLNNNQNIQKLRKMRKSKNSKSNMIIKLNKFRLNLQEKRQDLTNRYKNCNNS